MNRWCAIVVLYACCWLPVVAAQAATPAEVNQAVARGAAFLRGTLDTAQGGRPMLGALALLKAGIPPEDPSIQSVLNKTLARCLTGVYIPGVNNTEAIYTAAVDAMLLMEISPEKYKPQIQLVANYLVAQQQDNGGWNYPDLTGREASAGDTSVTQYACMGLWAAERAKVAIRNDVWLKVLTWHARVQNNDGGFAYAPGMAVGDGNGQPTLNMTVNGVGSMQIAIMHLAPGFLPLQEAVQKQSNEPARFGVLEKLDVSEQSGLGVTEEGVRIPQEAITSMRKAYQWVTVRYRVENPDANKVYYYYSLERMASLINTSVIGTHDWYNECSDFLLRNQRQDGSWSMTSLYGAEVDTAFAMLFLARATGKLLQRTRPADNLGEGLMVGGRGLPDDLKQMDFNARRVSPGDANTQPLDALLRSLQNTGEISIDDVQERIVEQVQLGNREELVGRADQLIALLKHPQADVRKTAIWAMGRSDRLNLAEHLIRALNDPDLGVMVEAQNALCWLSRRPNGLGLVEDPLTALPPGSTDAQKKAAIAAWHKAAVLGWGEWFLRNRPFSDRGDEYESTLKAQLQQLKNAN